MNETILQELKRVVEQVVWPVHATLARKRRMREELLAHLAAIFEEEAQRLGDDRAALDQARRRFGDPLELTVQLQQAVPPWNRCRAILENMGCHPGESAWHVAAKHFLVLLTVYAIPLLPLSIILACGKLPRFGAPVAQHHVAIAALLALPVIALLNVFLSVVFAHVLSRIGPALTSKRSGRILLRVLCVLVAPCCLMLPAFAGAAALLIAMACQTVAEWRYRIEWA